MIHDVIIAGAGPVGLLLACELGLHGVSVLVLERAAEASAPNKQLPFGMRGLTVPTVEALYRRGLLSDIALAQPPGRQGGHFAGIAIDDAQVDAAAWPWCLPGPAGMPMAATMERVETVLAARAVVLGVAIRRGSGVDDVTQSVDHVTVRAGDTAFQGRWLVGCDGGRSTVRKAAGFVMEGTPPAFTGYSVQADLAEPLQLAMGRQLTPGGMYMQVQPGVIAMADFDGGAGHRSTPLTRAHVQAVLRRISGTGVTLNALRFAATWTDRTMLATAYRNGCVLLAGDAAHLHSPLGGQGLNLGLGDAMNLGWKLAATVRGTAPAGLLDSYAAERQPVAVQVLDWSRAQVALLRPGAEARALAAIVRDLIGTGAGATYFAERIQGRAARYDLDGGHPLTGRSVPDFTFADGTRMGALMQGGAGILLDFTGHAILREVGQQQWPGLQYHDGVPADCLGLSAVLVRPDGIVAWACAADGGFAGLVPALERWFGDACAR